MCWAYGLLLMSENRFHSSPELLSSVLSSAAMLSGGQCWGAMSIPWACATRTDRPPCLLSAPRWVSFTLRGRSVCPELLVPPAHVPMSAPLFLSCASDRGPTRLCLGRLSGSSQSEFGLQGMRQHKSAPCQTSGFSGPRPDSSLARKVPSYCSHHSSSFRAPRKFLFSVHAVQKVLHFCLDHTF